MENMLCCLMKTKIMLSNEDYVMLSNEDCAKVCCVTKIRMQESPIHSLDFFITMQRFMMPFMST